MLSMPLSFLKLTRIGRKKTSIVSIEIEMNVRIAEEWDRQFSNGKEQFEVIKNI